MRNIYVLCFVTLISILFGSSEAKPNDLKVSYTIWVNDNVDVSYTLHNLKVPTGATFFEVMNIAAGKDARFQFVSQSFTFGEFITSIGGYAQQPQDNKFWMIYILDKNPNPNPAHRPESDELSPLGVSSLIVEDKKHYLFWLKTVVF